jgi:hypothetical protein
LGKTIKPTLTLSQDTENAVLPGFTGTRSQLRHGPTLGKTDYNQELQKLQPAKQL